MQTTFLELKKLSEGTNRFRKFWLWSAKTKMVRDVFVGQKRRPQQLNEWLHKICPSLFYNYIEPGNFFSKIQIAITITFIGGFFLFLFQIASFGPTNKKWMNNQQKMGIKGDVVFQIRKMFHFWKTTSPNLMKLLLSFGFGDICLTKWCN